MGPNAVTCILKTRRHQEIRYTCACAQGRRRREDRAERNEKTLVLKRFRLEEASNIFPSRAYRGSATLPTMISAQ